VKDRLSAVEERRQLGCPQIGFDEAEPWPGE
jgi:hypothetical protein